MRPSDKIACLQEQLQAERKLTAMLRAQLAAAGVEAVEALPAWASGLTPNDLALMMMLLKAHPRPVPIWSLADNLPKRDHTIERSEECIRTHVHRCRAALGKGAIEQIPRRGYRCSDAFVREHGAPS